MTIYGGYIFGWARTDTRGTEQKTKQFHCEGNNNKRSRRGTGYVKDPTGRASLILTQMNGYIALTHPCRIRGVHQ